jgi:hypothetical protein
MKKSILYILTLFAFFSCGEEKTPPDDVYKIRDIGHLSTTEYTVGKIIKVDDSNYDVTEFEWEDWTKLPKVQYGDRRILISCKSKVKAGIDLSKIQDGDITVVGSTIEIKLPPAEITSFSMDPRSVRTQMEDRSGYTDPFTEEEKTDFLKQGEESIREDLNDYGILEDANDNAEAFLIDFYKQLGYKKVVVKRSKSDDE